MIWIMLFISVTLGACGQIFMKIAMNQAGTAPLDSRSVLSGGLSESWDVLRLLATWFLGALFSWPMVAAVLSYALSYVLWLFILSRTDLSFARPFVSFGYIIVILYGYFAGEHMNWERLLGIFLIIIGLVFVARSAMSV